jgi:uncharacterized protein YecE (DUF72 family)
MIRIGTAGWSVPTRYRANFPASGSQLEKYATQLTAAEINSSFYRPHRRTTYERWAASVPADFRFAVKLPRTISHERKLRDCRQPLVQFLSDVEGLGGKLAVLLVQLPPKLVYDKKTAASFFRALGRTGYAIACEARHESWFARDADQALKKLRVARVAADPPRAPTDGAPGGDTNFAYWRMHGSPRIYYSDYPEEKLVGLAHQLREGDWCIFDNTVGYHAMGNALRVQELTTQ